MTAVTEQDAKGVVRPLKLLTALIKTDIEHGDQAAERAGMEFYRLAGAKLAEVKEDHFDGRTAEFYAWADRNFHKSQARIRAWVQLSGHDDVKSLKSIRESEGAARKPGGSVYRPWTASAQLGRRLIDIGYRVLAKELHPDKGGSKDAMSRLGRVRDRLRSNV